MRSPFALLRMGLVLGISLAWSTLACGQNENNRREPFQAAGKLQAVAPGGVQIETSDDEVVNVKLQAKPVDISFTANAEPNFLKPGMMVRFTAVLNKRGQVTDPITSLTVFTPLERGDVGVYPENPDTGPNPLGGIFSDPSEEQPKRKPAKKIVGDTEYRIGGRIASLKGSKMMVAAGGTQIKCELSDNVKVKVSLADLSYARLGDKVEVEGWQYPAMPQAGAVANRISVTAVNPLVAADKKPRPGAKSEPKEPSSDEEDDEKQDDEKKKGGEKKQDDE